MAVGAYSRAGEVGQHPRVVWIVLDDQQDGVARLQVGAVVRHGIRWVLRTARERVRLDCGCRDGRPGPVDLRPHRRRRPHVGKRQIEREDRADSELAAQMDFAAQQIGQLAADGEAKAGAAILAVG